MKLGASGENGSERLFCVRILCMNAYAPGYDRNTHPERMQEREERRMMFAAASPSTVGRAIAAVPAGELVAA